MMKRSAIGSLYEIPAPLKEQKVPTSIIPGSGDTKVLWHSDMTGLVGPREEESRRKSPEMRFLYIVSACLTIMVLWGIFRQVHILIPKLFDSPEAGAEQDLTTLSRIHTDSRAFQADAVGLGDRNEAKRLLEVPAEEFLLNQPRRFGTPSKELDREEQTALPRPGGFKTLPREVQSRHANTK